MNRGPTATSDATPDPRTSSADGSRPVVELRLFAAARMAAGTRSDRLSAATVDEAVGAACERYGPDFSAVVAISRVWVNGSPADGPTPLSAGDEVAILPPVSGGGA